MTNLLTTFSYTCDIVKARYITTFSFSCNIVKARYSGQLSANFPGAFFVAYQNWSEATRGYTVKEVSQELLEKVESEEE